MTSLDCIKNKISTVSLYNDCIVHVKYHDHSFIELKDAQEAIKSYLELSPDRKMPVVIEMGYLSQPSNDMSAWFKENPNPAPAEAFIIRSLAQRFFINVYLKLKYQPQPKKAVTSLEKAEEWFKSIKVL